MLGSPSKPMEMLTFNELSTVKVGLHLKGEGPQGQKNRPRLRN